MATGAEKTRAKKSRRDKIEGIAKRVTRKAGKIHREPIQTDTPTVVSKKTAETMPEAPLPPKGYKRREVQARRQAKLDKQADLLSKHIDVIDPQKFEGLTARQRIAQVRRLGVLHVSNKNPNFQYLWSRFSGTGGKVLLTKRLTLGWKIVGQGGENDDGEGVEHKGTTGHRIIADELMLLRMPRQLYDEYKAIQREEAMERQGYSLLSDPNDPEENQKHVTDKLRDLVRTAKGGVKVIQFNDYADPRLGATFVRGMGSPQLDGMLRRGGVPGMNPGVGPRA